MHLSCKAASSVNLYSHATTVFDEWSPLHLCVLMPITKTYSKHALGRAAKPVTACPEHALNSGNWHVQAYTCKAKWCLLYLLSTCLTLRLTFNMLWTGSDRCQADSTTATMTSDRERCILLDHDIAHTYNLQPALLATTNGEETKPKHTVIAPVHAKAFCHCFVNCLHAMCRRYCSPDVM